MATAKKKAKLHELLAVSGDRAAVSDKVIDEAIAGFHKKDVLFMGYVATLKMIDADRAENENITDIKPLTTTVPEKLAYVAGRATPYLDLLLQWNRTNQTASASIEIDGAVFDDLPATFLLSLESKLKKIRSLYAEIPTLDPGVDWEADADAGHGRWRQKTPSVNFRTEKQLKSKIIVPASKEHPAQIQTWNEDVPIGRKEMTRHSGLISSAVKAQLLANIDDLLRRVKAARQRANNAEVVPGKIGKALFDFIHKDL